MGTILQERAPQQRLERASTRDREWRRRASLGGGGRPNAASGRMGKRPSQRKCLQPQQENHHEKQRPQQRRKHKPNTSSAKHTAGRHSAQGSLESKLEDRMEPKVQVAAENCGHREQTLTGPGLSGRTSASPCPGSPHQPEGHSLRLEVSSQGETDSDTDLSESERRPASSSVRVPPQLELRPEVIDAPDRTTQRRRARGQSCDGYDFPDFLPPPFNSWNLRQLAMFYNTEGRRAPRPRPAGSLERYLERLLQLEWHQFQTVQEESGESSASDVTYSCHRSAAAAAASSRLSSPKCILQCQRAFPLTFLSSLVSHSALLSSCTCTVCCIRYFTCSTSCCHTAHSHARPSRISPVLERREPVSLPRRSCSESRARQGHGSPVRTVTHLRRMQASGNIRNPAQGADVKPLPTGRETAGTQGHAAGVRKRSGSEQRRRGAERQQNGGQKPRSGSECRQRRMERRETTEEVKPDAVTAIMDNLPASKYSAVNRPNRQKQVEFVT